MNTAPDNKLTLVCGKQHRKKEMGLCVSRNHRLATDIEDPFTFTVGYKNNLVSKASIFIIITLTENIEICLPHNCMLN